MGTNTCINGLSCSPSSPASLNVVISPGEIYSMANIDSSAYSSISADTAHSILKQGVSLNSTTLAITPPTTSGYSINYLVQYAFQEVDTDSATLAYYNSSNPNQAWSGPGNTGTAQYTTRSCQAVIALKAGVAATTGAQATPSADSGYTPAWVITVANGQTTITSANITQYANAPFLPSSGIVQAIQSGKMLLGTDSGTANAYVVSMTPGLSTMTDAMRLCFRAANANTGSSTLNVSNLGAYPIVNAFGATLLAGEIAANSIVTVLWNATLASFMLLSATSAIPTVPTASTGTATRQAASTEFVANAITAATGRLLNVQKFSTAGTYTYTPTSGAKSLVVEVIGAGGGGGSASGASTSAVALGSGGGGGGYAKSYLTSVPTSQSVVVGAGGAPATNGGNSSFGSIVANGGGAGGSNISGTWTSGALLTRGGGGGSSSGGNITNASGGCGGTAIWSNAGNCVSGCGGSSILSGSASSIGGGSGYGVSGATGAGGSGANSNQSTTLYAGGNGGDGLVVIYEYA